MIECNVCLEDKPESEFHNLTIGVSGHEPYWSCLIDDACKSCLDPNDIRIYSRRNAGINASITYEILNQPKYLKTRQINWCEKVLDVSFNDILSNSEALNIVNESGVNCIQNRIENDKYKALRKNLKSKEELGLIPGPLKLPVTLTGAKSNFFHLKSTIERYVSLSKKGKYTRAKLYKIPFQRLVELAKEDYVAFDKKGNVCFLTNKEEGNTVCRKCGNIKLFKEFVYTGKDKSILTFQCVKCANQHASNKYNSLSPEEKRNHIDAVKHWRRNNRDKLREYEKTPEARVARNLRRRLKGFLKTNDHNFNKDIGCTRKELVQHLESLFDPGMNWENYGSGENGDHKDSWHIDHIIPISKFTGKSPNHFTNLQPMWGLENIQKSNKISHQTVLNLIS
jgi:hypothetical protein